MKYLEVLDFTAYVHGHTGSLDGDLPGGADHQHAGPGGGGRGVGQARVQEAFEGRQDVGQGLPRPGLGLDQAVQAQVAGRGQGGQLDRGRGHKALE